MTITTAVAERIADRMKRDGFDRCEPQDVLDVANHGTLTPSVVGDDYDAALESRILQELEEYGFSS